MMEALGRETDVCKHNARFPFFRLWPHAFKSLPLRCTKNTTGEEQKKQSTKKTN